MENWFSKQIYIQSFIGCEFLIKSEDRVYTVSKKKGKKKLVNTMSGLGMKH